MKGELNKFGVLMLERSGVMVHAECVHDKTRYCRDRCASFKEEKGKPHETYIILCNTMWVFQEFKDSRLRYFDEEPRDYPKEI